MALTANIPASAFVNRFPTITISGSPNERLVFSLVLGGVSVLDQEVYFFDSSGIVSIRFLGNTLEKHFYDANYEVKRFALPAVFSLKCGAETLTRTVDVYFCRTYVSGETLTAEMMRSMPLSRCRRKRVLPGAGEYISFVSQSGVAVLSDVAYMDGSVVRSKRVSLYTFASSDVFQTIDVSAGAMGLLTGVLAGSLLYWDVYASGHKDLAIRYMLDGRSSFVPTVFVFQNCFGALESFVCRGICKRGHHTEREMASMGGRYFVANQTSLLSFTVNTGGLNEALSESLIDLLNCRSLMVLQDGVAIPVFIDSDNVSLPNYRDKLATAEFTYSYSAKNLSRYRYDKSLRIFDYTFDQTFN